jgi:putative RNA 2'-phosphotransferase
MENEELVSTSKYLSFILRHNPGSIGLKLDENGWAKIDELIECSSVCASDGKKGKMLTKEIIFLTVENNSKKRFALDPEKTKIRAVQGHSIDVDVELKEQVPPQVLYHGTATRFLESIMKKGLLPSGRNHVHLSSDIKTAVNVGARHGKPVVLEINSESMHRDGYVFFISENGVWLTDTVPPCFIKQI